MGTPTTSMDRTPLELLDYYFRLHRKQFLGKWKYSYHAFASLRR